MRVVDGERVSQSVSQSVVLADSGGCFVPGSLEYLGHPGSRNSSGMDPSPRREISPLPGTVYLDPGSKRRQ